MFILTRLLCKTLQVCALAFVLLSVVYTTGTLAIWSLSYLVSRALTLSYLVTPNRLDLLPTTRRVDRHENIFDVPRPVYPPVPEAGSQERTSAPHLQWVSTDFTLQHGLGHQKPIIVSEKTVLSKAFSNSMRPSNVIPYFYRATGPFEADQVTITTLITSNRFEVFARLAEKYQGPISVTLHIKDVAEHVQEVLEALHELYTSSLAMITYVDVHLVVDNFERQFNTWRNTARLFARTDFVMMLDIDFYPCTDFRDIVKRSASVLAKLYDSTAALVIPAFEYVDFHEGTHYESFPKDKSTLLYLVKQGRIRVFHASWSPGHNSTDYKRFYGSQPGEIYKVTTYQAAYEPYVIFKRDGPPWCDERFVGYGGNKAACLFELYLSGMSYYVAPDHFIIHQNHLYEESARKSERKYNKKVYIDFKEEMCLRYLERFLLHDLLRAEPAENALSECKKIKSVVKMVKQFFDEDI